MKPRFLLHLLLMLGIMENAMAGTGDIIELENTDNTYAETKFQHTIPSISTGSEGE